MMTTATVAAAALLIKLLGSTDEDSSGSSGSGVGSSSNTAVAEPPATSNAVATSSSSSLLHARGRDDHHANTSAAAAVDSATTTTPTTSTTTNTDVTTSDTTPSTSTTTTTENMICRYFLQGTCRFGPRCHFSHDLSNVENVSAAQKDLGQQHELAKQNAMRQQQSTNTSTTTTTTEEDESEETPSTSTKIHNRMSKAHSDAAALDRQALVDKQRLAWANAPVFVPGRYVYVPAAEDEEEDVEEPLEADGAEATAEPCAAPAPTWASIVGGGGSSTNAAGGMPLMSESEVCPFEGPCPYGHNCGYPVHLELCEMCDQYCLHPTDAEQRRKHKKECLQHHEQAMELSFAIARSKDKTCGICFDTIMEKAGREKRFGILPNCSHIFCLECIRKWRQAKQFEHKITRSCPECRIASDFVCPSAFWVETKEEKDKLLNDYRAALGIKDCKYFKKGDGRCPFGNKCFYKHALPNGDLVDVGLPKRARKVLRSSSETTDLLAIYLWEYVDIRDFQRYNMISIESDNDDDDYMRENYDLSLSDVSTDSDLYF